jgi:hypothetical protein
MKTNNLLVIISMLTSGCWEAGTQYTTQEVPRKFRTIETGNSLHEVYRKLGQPFFADVNLDVSGHGAARMEGLAAGETNRMLSLMEDPNVEIILNYSRNRTGTNMYYKLYLVRLRQGEVVAKEGPRYMD